ncbi:efflux RND transporter periplasmic adaptor subunit [Salinisphaera orenii]|nr:efflux RND transporter periplasmic adaptor subunit [Salinisphaera orenii]
MTKRPGRARRLMGIAVLGGMLAAGCTDDGRTATAGRTTDHTKAVRVATVRRGDADRRYTLSGVTRAAQRAQLAFQASGRLAARPVDIGAELAAGDLVARLDQPELGPAADAAAADVRGLQTRFEQAERDLRRVRRLVEQDAATRQELEDTRARRDSLAAQLDNARAQRERAVNAAGELTLTAPIAGSVTRVFFEPGEFVPAGQPVVALSGGRALEVAFGVPERLVQTLEIGDSARLTLPLFAQREIAGTLTGLSRASGGRGELFRAVIALDETDSLRPGLSVSWHVSAASEPGLLVPASAIASPGLSHAPRVYVLRDGVAHAIPVTPGTLIGESVRVEGALEVDERVVTRGLHNLVDGQTVRVLEDNGADGAHD